MRILVVGAGATGGYFGGRLAEAGRDVTFLVRPARAEQLRATGLQIRSPVGDATIAPKLVTADRIETPFDAILLSVKAYALEPAMDDMAQAVGPDTMILPVLNGMRHMDLLTGRFGAGCVLGGVCRIAGDLDPEGRIVQMSPMHDLLYGEMDGSRTPRIEALDQAMQAAKFNALLSPRIEAEMWNKWLLLASLGGITCLMRGTVGEVVAAPDGERFVNRFVDEVVATMAAAGHKPAEKPEAFARTTLTTKGSSFASSMFRDLQKGRPVEADQIVGDLLARAQALGLDTPLLLAAATHLASYQARLAA